MLKSRLMKYSLKLPNRLHVSVIGYADDSTVVVNDEIGIVDCLNVIHCYERATGAKINMKKTSILGIGKWQGKSVWPISGLKVEYGTCKILGIYHANNYERSLTLNWENVELKLNRLIGIMQSRKLTILQKAVVINCKILAKTWYLSHVYPIPTEYAKRIQKSVFKYLWNGNYEPINRRTMYLPKCRGGCGILDIVYKTKALLFNTFCKGLSCEKLGFRLMIYYCQIKATFLIDNHGFNEATLVTP